MNDFIRVNTELDFVEFVNDETNYDGEWSAEVERHPDNDTDCIVTVTSVGSPRKCVCTLQLAQQVLERYASFGPMVVSSGTTTVVTQIPDDDDEKERLREIIKAMSKV